MSRAKPGPLEIPPTRNHRQLAAWINAQNLVDGEGRAVRATVEPWTTNTDREFKGSRLRWPGKGRRGLRLQIRLVKSIGGWTTFADRDVLYEQESGDCYARHDHAREWVAKNLRRSR